jgi:TIR domain
MPSESARGRTTAGSPTDAPSVGRGRIFISYRREDTAYPAGWLYDRLAERFGRAQVFKDVDSIELGDDFVEVITNAVASTDVLLALIGKEWLTIADEDGAARLEDPHDFVRLEIEAACTRNVLLIPILVDGATMPRREQLPPSIAAMSHRQALELSPSRFEFDTSRLIRVLEATLGEVGTAVDDELEARIETSGEGERIREERVHEERDLAPPPIVPGAPIWLRQPRVLIAAGATIVALVVAVVVAVIATRSDSSTEGSTNPSPTTTSSPPTTTSQDGGVPGAVLADDFSGDELGWRAALGAPPAQANDTRAEYGDGLFRISAEPVTQSRSVWYVPADASAVTPAAPPNVDVSVAARKLTGSSENTGYGLACRTQDDKAYLFLVSATGGEARVAKAFPQPPYLRSFEGWTRLTSLASEDVNRLRAVCTTTTGGGVSEHQLTFFVNGTKLIEAVDDTGKGFGKGSVGIVVTTGGDALEVEFDEFVVRQTAPP